MKNIVKHFGGHRLARRKTRRIFFLLTTLIGLIGLIGQFGLTPSAIGGEEIYFPPTADMPEILATFGNGQISREDFRGALRARLTRTSSSASGDLIMQVALEDMANFSERTGVTLPIGAKFYGWGNEVVMTVDGRDFTWREAVDLFIIRIATVRELTLALSELIDQTIIRHEASAILEREIPADIDAISALREALAPLFTPEALNTYYVANKKDFLVLKVGVKLGSTERIIYAAADPDAAGIVPITEYGVDYLRTPSGLQSPLAALPANVISALRDADELFDEDYSYRVVSRLYPRNPSRLLPLLTGIRLRDEITRLLDAVKENELQIFWQPN